MKCLLDQAIQRTGNAQDAYSPPCGFGISTLRTAPGMYSPDNRACFIFGECLQPWLKLQNREPIDSRCSFVFHHPLVGAQSMLPRSSAASRSPCAASGFASPTVAVRVSAPDAALDGFRHLPPRRHYLRKLLLL